MSVDGADQFSIFNFYGVSSGAGFDEVSGLTVTHGLAHNGDSSGGGVVTRNTSADLTISDTVITQNTASNDGGGVQAYNASGIVAILGTTISDNTTTGGGGGAFYAIANSALTVRVSDSTITGNTAASWGGAFYMRGGSLDVDNTTISGNSTGANGRGGGIRMADGPLNVNNSTISGNTARDGGGVHLYNSNATIAIATISDNTATGGGGGGIMAHYDDGTGATVTVRNSTVSGNRSQYYGGGLYVANSGQSTIENSTISGNTAAQGGAIFSFGGGATLTQTTISGNSATNPRLGNPAVGGVLISGAPLVPASAPGAQRRGAAAETDKASQESGARDGHGGVHAASANTVDSIGTIIAGNIGEDVGAFRSTQPTLNSDHSVLGTVSAAVTVNDQGGTQRNVADAGLGPLTGNGGPTQTMALLPGSVAIDAGPVPVPVFPGNDFDQRGEGFVRVVDGVVDVGAFEVQPPAAPERPAAIVITPKFTG